MDRTGAQALGAAVLFLGSGAALVVAVALALLIAAYAYRRAIKTKGMHPPKTAGDVWLGVGNALFAGGAVALAIFAFQQTLRNDIDRAKAETDFLSRIALTADLPGFDPPPTKRAQWTSNGCAAPSDLSEEDQRALGRLAGLSFAAKNLEGARLDGMTFKRTIFRDARLVGVTFTCADLESANLERADLHGAVLTGADLTGADLRGARIDAALWDVRDWTGAMVDMSTCWPKSGPWESESASRWMNDHHLAAFALGNRRPAYGHFCNDRSHRVIYADGTHRTRHVPLAIGPTDAYSAGRWRQEMLRTLQEMARSRPTHRH